MWVRGLKHLQSPNQEPLVRSHPVWVRGLKQQASDVNDFANWVAPRVGAWIETVLPEQREETECVAPRVGAWIETK